MLAPTCVVGARRDSGPVPIHGLKLQGLLALLALSAPALVPDGRLIDELWGDDDLADPSNSLHAQISILRRAPGRDLVVRQGLGYGLVVDAEGTSPGWAWAPIHHRDHRACATDPRFGVGD